MSGSGAGALTAPACRGDLGVEGAADVRAAAAGNLAAEPNLCRARRAIEVQPKGGGGPAVGVDPAPAMHEPEPWLCGAKLRSQVYH